LHSSDTGEKWECNETVYQLFVDFKKPMIMNMLDLVFENISDISASVSSCPVVTPDKHHPLKFNSSVIVSPCPLLAAMLKVITCYSIISYVIMLRLVF
jgi:energy-converting hydrogenase Eha subunit A